MPLSASERLVGPGFTEFKAGAYPEMQRLGPATGSQTSREFGIRRSGACPVLDEVVDRGAACTQSPGDMTRCLAVPGDALLDRHRRKLDDALADRSRGLEYPAGWPVAPGQTWAAEGRDYV